MRYRIADNSFDYSSLLPLLFAQGESTAREIGARFYKECSSLRNEGVDDIFEAATRQAMLVRAGASSAGGSGNGLAIGTNGRSTSSGGGLNSGGPLSNAGASSGGFSNGGEKNDRRKSSGGALFMGGEKGNGFKNNSGSHGGEGSSKGCCVIV